MTAAWAAAALLDTLRAEVAGVLDDEHASRPSALEQTAAKLATVAVAFHATDDQLADGEGIEPHCATCGAWIGIFYVYGLTEWRHFRGDPAPGGQRELYEAGHEAAPACPAQARTAGQALADAIAYRLERGRHRPGAGLPAARRRPGPDPARNTRGGAVTGPGRPTALITGLPAWTRGHDRHVRAAVELLIEHDVWLRRADFTRACIVRSGREAYVNRVAARAFAGAGAVASTARPIWRCRMTKHDIAIEIDETKLASYTDTYLAMCWHIAQHNPAPHGDYFAGPARRAHRPRDHPPLAQGHAA